MHYDSIVSLVILLLLGVNLFVLIILLKRKQPEEKNNEQIFKDEVNSLKNSFSQSFGSEQRDCKDMTGALTKVDEKVSVFNQQVGELNKSQDNFSRILSGVKTYGTLAEFGLDCSTKRLITASQFMLMQK